jgi:diguanylate cyclase
MYASALFVTVLVEIGMFFLLNHFDIMDPAPDTYFFRYVMVPTAGNLLLLMTTLVAYVKGSHTVKKYVLSIAMGLSCEYVLFIHGGFTALYIMPVIAVLLTTIYGDYCLTTVTTAILMMILEMVIVWFGRWDRSKVMLQTDMEEMVNFPGSDGCLFLIYGLSMIIIHFERQKRWLIVEKDLEQYEMQRELLKDGLTGNLNRYALDQALQQMQKITTTPYIIAMIDIDHFKK